MIKINGKTSKSISMDDFEELDVLIFYDYPLLILMNYKKDNSKWILRWIDSNEDETDTKNKRIDRWMLFDIKENQLNQLKNGELSLREAIYFYKHSFYVVDTDDHRRSRSIRETRPHLLPAHYLPKVDLTLNGQSDTIYKKIRDRGHINIGMHIISEKIKKGEMPLALFSFNEIFQKYVKWAAEYIRFSLEKTNKRTCSLPFEDWIISMHSFEPGSIRIFCDSPEEDQKRISIMMESCEHLVTLSNQDLEFDRIMELENVVGQRAIMHFRAILQFISDMDLAIHVKWISPIKAEEKDIFLDKRTADRIIGRLKRHDKLNREMMNINIKLTDEEVALLKKPIRGEGGWQVLLQRLQKKVSADNTISISPSEIETIIRYCQNYGEGGWQKQLSSILTAIGRMGTYCARIR